MYLTDAVILGSGAIEKVILKPQFNIDGSPKPIVFVGANGSGKTGLLSTIADGLIELAATHFDNVTATSGASRRYFRIIGNRTQRIGSRFELSALKFKDKDSDYCYRAKAGDVDASASLPELVGFEALGDLPSGNDKRVNGEPVELGRIFNAGVYTFFPSSRSEIPYWATHGALDREPTGDFSIVFSKSLTKPIVVQTAIQELKPWIMNLMLDTIVNVEDVLSLDSQKLRAKALLNTTYMSTYGALSQIVQIILRSPAMRIAWLNRAFGERRIAVITGDELVLPTIDCLSTGQATLLAIFGTILRYGDVGVTSTPLGAIEGIVLVDEADAHLHADLQHDALPALMKLFPRVQFILTSHAPLFPLGMRKTFGDDGFTLVELPTGLTIDPERFTEFESSYAYFRATKVFEEGIQSRLKEAVKPLVLCEGETDPKYLRTAAVLLGMEDFLNHVDIDWIGLKTGSGSKGSGKENLEVAFKFLSYNPGVISRKVVLLYDYDAKRERRDIDGAYVRSLPYNSGNNVRKTGIENLLPEEVFEARFFKEEVITSGGDPGVVQRLRKVMLCGYLCDEKRALSDFQHFRSTLTELQSLLCPPPTRV